MLKNMLKTMVWWDVVTCPVPKSCDSHLIASNIRSALDKMGYKGGLSISAFGDDRRIPESIQQAFKSTKITLFHIPVRNRFPGDAKYDAKTRMSEICGALGSYIWCWDPFDRPPVNYLLISNEFGSYAQELYGLREYGCNTVLELPPDRRQAEWELLMSCILDGGELPSSWECYTNVEYPPDGPDNELWIKLNLEIDCFQVSRKSRGSGLDPTSNFGLNAIWKLNASRS